MRGLERVYATTVYMPTSTATSRRRRPPLLTVSESRGLRYLHVGGEAIQSAMRVAEPDALALDYTRAMMAFLLFHYPPREVLSLGLGGGSIAKFVRRQFPGARQRIVELDPRVVAAAREHFALPADDARFSVEIGDGLAALAPECCDTLFVDVFDDELPVPAFTTRAFFDAAWMTLRSPGVMVMNFMSDDPNLDRHLQRFEAAFDGAVLCMTASADPNLIAYGLKGAPPVFPWATLAERAAVLEARHGLPFRRFVAGLRRMNLGDATSLFTTPRAG